MKKYIFHIKPWSWSCGDGCCSDSGCDVEVYPENGSGPRFNFECGYERPHLGGIFAYLITDAIDKLSSDDIAIATFQADKDKNRSQEFRKRMFEAFGVEDTCSDWCWSSGLPNVSYEKAKEIFAKFNVDMEFVEEDQPKER